MFNSLNELLEHFFFRFEIKTNIHTLKIRTTYNIPTSRKVRSTWLIFFRNLIILSFDIIAKDINVKRRTGTKKAHTRLIHVTR